MAIAQERTPNAPVVQCALCQWWMHVEDDAPELVLHRDCETRMEEQDPDARARFAEAATAARRADALDVLQRYRQRFGP